MPAPRRNLVSRTSETSPVHRTVRCVNAILQQSRPFRHQDPVPSLGIELFRELFAATVPRRLAGLVWGREGLRLGEFEAPDHRGLENSLDP